MKRVYLRLFLLMAPPARIEDPPWFLDHAGGGLLDLPEKEEGEKEKRGKREKREKEKKEEERRGKNCFVEMPTYSALMA